MIDFNSDPGFLQLPHSAQFDAALSEQNMPAFIRHPVDTVKSEYRHVQLNGLAKRIEVVYPAFQPPDSMANNPDVKIFVSSYSNLENVLPDRLNAIKANLGGTVYPRLLPKEVRHMIRNLGYMEQSIHTYYQQAHTAVSKRV
jgi:hypothetical protein